MVPVLTDQANRQRNHHRLFDRLAGRRRDNLATLQSVFLASWVKMATDRYFRRPCLIVPAHKLREIMSACVRKTLKKLLYGGGLSVVTRKIKVHPGTKFFTAN